VTVAKPTLDRRGIVCRYCEHAGKGRHRKGCPSRVLAAARDWLERFGYDPGCITPTGRDLFRRVIEIAERGGP
jgi:hypothetical protein